MSARRFASLAGALLVAAIAALASYTHMRTVTLRYGQPPLIADLLPVSVDGMMAVATVALGDGRRNRWSAWLAFWTGVTASVVANVLAAQPSLPARCISAWPAIAFVLVIEVITRSAPNRPNADGAPRPDRRQVTRRSVSTSREPDGATGPRQSTRPVEPSAPPRPEPALRRPGSSHQALTRRSEGEGTLR